MIALNWKSRLVAVLPWFAFVLIVLGVRLSVCNRLATDAPLSDDWRVFDEIATVHDGKASLFSSHLLVPHGQHRIFFTKFQEALGVKLNGPWQLRIENVMHAGIFCLFAFTVTWLAVRASGKNGGLVYGLALATFAIPWAGGRTLWAFLSCFSWMMWLTVLGAWVLSSVQRPWLRAGLSLLLCGLATIALGSGSLTALVAASYFIWLGVHRVGNSRREHFVMAAFHLAMFLVVYLNIPKTTEELTKHDGLRTTLLPFLRGLGWPTVFAWPAGLLAFIPWFCLAWRWLKNPAAATKSESLLFLLGAGLVLQCAGIAIFRGENNNGGVPGNRYYDILMLGPLVNAAILALPKGLGLAPSKLAWGRGITFAWVGLTVAGMGVNFFWRVLPWATTENGEWDQGIRQARMAAYARGEIATIPQAKGTTEEDPYDLGHATDFVMERIDRKGNQQALLPSTVVGGFVLTPDSTSNGFVPGGFPPNYSGRDYLKYWGTFATSDQPDPVRRFSSEPITCELPYLCFDLILDKKARLKSYRLPSRSLLVERISDGVQIDVMGALKTTLPSILRDRESVCVKLPGPGSYRILATDDEVGHAWMAFSEPLAYGPLAAICHDVLNSGKLLLWVGLIFLGASITLRRLSATAERTPA
jgi:hypothetical protein